ncbi:MAG: Gfo/Idh/MocA family oxidoreductase [Thermoguttaceae bacterium]|nr:Gfo/Idh/MocA family oxidoreductase [Thermoguttaceae bacterium]
MSHKTSRRHFLKTTAVTGAGFLVCAGNAPQVARASALQSVAVAGIGVGGKGSGDIQQAGFYGKVVAVCDVDKRTLESKQKTFKDAKGFTDFRQLFADMGDKIDACTISTTDHMHTVITAQAMKLGKHVYTQKPLTRTIAEARYLGELAKKTGLCTQMGNQGSVEDTLRRSAAELRAGIIGEVKEVHVWTNRPIWPQGPDRAMTMERFIAEKKKLSPDTADDEIADKKKAVAAALDNVDWKLWIGTAPYREYWPGLYHSFAWRGWWDFGTGALGDMACHLVNMVFKGCDLRNPTSVVAKTSGHDFNSFPQTSVCEFAIPANSWRGPVRFVWYDSKQTPAPELAAKYGFGKFSEGGGSLVIGDKGAMYGGTSRAEGGKVLEAPKNLDYVIAPIDEQKRGGDARHKFEWFNAIWQNKPSLCWSDFIHQAGPLTETILLGNLATWAAPKAGEWGEKVEWDAANLKVTNLDKLKTPGVATLVKPKYANGYEQLP